jgi:LPXTG-site transpeptidase (sortase) family protein
METGVWPWKPKAPGSPAASRPAAGRARLGRIVSNVLFALGAFLLLAALTYAAYSVLNTWLMGQNRYLQGNEIAAMPVPAMTWTPSPTPTATPIPTHTATPTPIASPTPTATPLPPPAPIQIRIPALGVSRSIVPLPRARDPATGAWMWNTERLFRSGRSDLVGHWQGSANPGQEGNMVLVGHNYGYGYNGVFVRLGSLRRGDKVTVINSAGGTFVYEVQRVQRVPWRLQNFGELTQHLAFLAIGGPERLTLVSCAGADFEPFPERVYVVANPVGR